jgi:DNA ligase (NAD+)
MHSQGEETPLAGMVAKYLKCKDAYYNTATPLLTDLEFDKLERAISERSPGHPCLKAVGAAGGGAATALPCWMSSLDKFYPSDSSSLKSWLKRLAVAEERVSEGVRVVASPKLDGVSGILVMPPNAPPSLYSRGNGREGSDWSDFLPLIHGGSAIRNTTASRVVVRGELILRRDDFAEHGQQQYACSRAMVNGLLGCTRHVKPQLLRHVHFVAYAVYEPDRLPVHEQAELMRQLRLECVHAPSALEAVPYRTDTVDALIAGCSVLFHKWRKELAYDTDGVVVQSGRAAERCTSGNPTDAFAYKEECDDQLAETVVEDVVWRVSKHGFLKPTVLLAPVKIHGVTIKKATGFNAKFIKDSQIGKGAKVRVKRCGDVIPAIVAVLQPSSAASMPDRPCGWTASGVDIVLSDKDMAHDSAYLATRLALSFRIMGVKHASEAVAQKLVSAGLCTDFLGAVAITKEQLMQLDGFSDVSSDKLIGELRRATAKASAETWIASAHLFTRSIGPIKQKQILSALPLDHALPADGGRAVLEGLDGFSTKTVEKAMESLPAVREYWQAVCSTLKCTPACQNAKTGGAGVLLTGFRSVEIASLVEQLGGRIVHAWSSTVRLVVRKDACCSNQKVDAAMQHGTPVVTAAECSASLLQSVLQK